MVENYGGSLNARGKGGCLFPEKHTHGDRDPSMTCANGRVRCWSQGCFGEHGVDIFELVGIMENIEGFSDQKRRVLEIGGLVSNNGTPRERQIIRRYRWIDPNGNVAWHLRWEPGKPKFTWAQDEEGKRHGRGTCTPTLYDREAVKVASTVLIVAGERDAETVNEWLRDLGLYGETAATTTPDGEESVKWEYFEPISRTATVLLSGDNDSTGKDYVRKCDGVLNDEIKDLKFLLVPKESKDWTEWDESRGTAEAFREILANAEPYTPLVEDQETGTPWNMAQSALDFIETDEGDAEFLYEPLLARGSITEVFSPRGIGKTHVALAMAKDLSSRGVRVLLLDRDNSKREVRRRLRAWGAGNATLKVMTRDSVPPLTDTKAWRTFPFTEYDLLIIDSLDSSTEGVGEQDSAKPSRSIAPLLDIAHSADGPAILILGNTIKSGSHSRGSGIVEDRADIVFEVRDATDLRPSGEKPWHEELPAAGADAWAQRASRRKKHDIYRLAFVPSKFRIGEEPAPFIYEIDLTSEPWKLRNVTDEMVQAGDVAHDEKQQESAACVRRAIDNLKVEISKNECTKTDAEKLLSECGIKPRSAARDLIEQYDGEHWTLTKLTDRKGNPVVLQPIEAGTTSAAEMYDAKSAAMTGASDSDIYAAQSQSGRRKSTRLKPATDKGLSVGGISANENNCSVVACVEVITDDA